MGGGVGIYAGLIAIQHGIFEISHGSHPPDGRMLNVIGPPCQAERVWPVCFSAMTLIPNLFITGIAALLVGLGILVWSVAFAGCRHGGLVLGALSLLALLVGGGFVPVFIGLVAAVTSGRLGAPGGTGGTGWRIVSRCDPGRWH